MPRHLPLPKGQLAFIPTLQLVEKLERENGSLLKLAGDLVQKNIPLSRVLDILCLVYSDAGCTHPADSLRTFLWRGMALSPVALLSDILIDILTPLQGMDVFETEGGAAGE